jgi:hypothetical protein
LAVNGKKEACLIIIMFLNTKNIFLTLVITTVLAELIIIFAVENRGFYSNLIIGITSSTAGSLSVHVVFVQYLLRLHNKMDTAIFIRIETAR